jgi:hypothetical protein
MADRKKLQQQLDELRGEIAALRAERAVAKEAAARSAAPARVPGAERAGRAASETEHGEKSLPDKLAAAAAGKTGDLERVLAELLETTEAEIAEHPALAAGLAFLAGFAVGRMSKG